MSLGLKWVSCRQHIYGSCVFIHSASLCLLVGAFNPLIFKVIIDMYVPIAIFLIVWGWFCRSFSSHLPRMPSNTVLVSGPAVGAAQTLIWPYSCMFLPPMHTAIRTSVFSFVGVLNGLLYIPQTVCLVDCAGFNLQLVQLVERFWVFFLSHTAPGFQLWFYSHLYMWWSTDV